MSANGLEIVYTAIVPSLQDSRGRLMVANTSKEWAAALRPLHLLTLIKTPMR